ncbi:hypothetical protein [Moraxella lacunata]|uniref:hypothetical protein n=1 Tax=Moraxella lacunata TaxID=477 RepID=UPI003EDF8A0D
MTDSTSHKMTPTPKPKPNAHASTAVTTADAPNHSRKKVGTNISNIIKIRPKTNQCQGCTFIRCPYVDFWLI